MKHFAGAPFAALVVGAGVALAPFAGASASGRRGDKEGEAHVPARPGRHSRRDPRGDCRMGTRSAGGLRLHVPWSSVREPHIRCTLERSDATKCKVEATLSF